MKHAIAMLFALGCTAGACSKESKPTATQAAAEATYGAMLLDCVDRATTLAESKACRAEVDRKWNITQKDGGR